LYEPTPRSKVYFDAKVAVTAGNPSSARFRVAEVFQRGQN